MHEGGMSGERVAGGTRGDSLTKLVSSSVNSLNRILDKNNWKSTNTAVKLKPERITTLANLRRAKQATTPRQVSLICTNNTPITEADVEQSAVP